MNSADIFLIHFIAGQVIIVLLLCGAALMKYLLSHN
jgi:hypothetical protein